MFAKGYNLDEQISQERILNHYTNEFGFNLTHKSNIDVFKSAIKPKNTVNSQNKGAKR